MDNNIEYSEEIEKVVNQQNEDCLLCGTEECRLINAENCTECTVGKLSKDKQEASLKALSRLREAAPQELVEPLYSGSSCLFCRGRRHKADSYGLFDLSKRDPEGDWTISLGKKKIGVKAADMILPLQVSCCKDCRKRFRLITYIPTVIGLIFGAAGLVISTLGPVYKAAYSAAPWLPAAIMLGFVLVGVCAAFIAKRLMVRSFGKKTHLNVSELPYVDELMERGFEEVLKSKGGVSNVVFSKTFREHGVGSLNTGEYLPSKNGCMSDPDEGELQIMGIWPAENYQDEKEEE